MDEVFGDGGWIEEYFDTKDPMRFLTKEPASFTLEGGGSTAIEFATFDQQWRHCWENCSFVATYS